MLWIEVSGKHYQVKSWPGEITLEDYIRISAIPSQNYGDRFISMNPTVPVSVCLYILETLPGWALQVVESIMETIETSARLPEDEQYYEGMTTVSANTLKKYWDALATIENSKGMSDYQLGGKIYAIYQELPETEVLKHPAPVAYRHIHFLLEDISRFNERFKLLGEAEVDPLLESAGVRNLDRYGRFATLLSLMKSLSLKKDEVLEIDAEFIYVTLQYLMDVDIIREEYVRLKGLPENQ